jgi:hypothetical protein
MVGSIVITVPALFYLLKSGPEETPHELKPHRSITNEIEAHEQEKGIQDSRKSEKPSERDPVRKTSLHLPHFYTDRLCVDYSQRQSDHRLKLGKILAPSPRNSKVFPIPRLNIPTWKTLARVSKLRAKRRQLKLWVQCPRSVIFLGPVRLHI